MILRKKIKSQVRKLKSYLAFNCKTVRDKKDALTFMTKLKKKVDDLLDDTETFMTSLHQTNPFEQGVPFRRSSVQYERFNGLAGPSKYRSVRAGGRSSKKGRSRCKEPRAGYLKDTFNSKYQRHINEIQKLTHVSRESKPFNVPAPNTDLDSRSASKKAFSTGSRSPSPISRTYGYKNNSRTPNKSKSRSGSKQAAKANLKNRPSWNINFSNQKIKRNNSQTSTTSNNARKTAIGFGRAKRSPSSNKRVFELEKEVSHLKNDNALLHRLVKNLQRELGSVKG